MTSLFKVKLIVWIVVVSLSSAISFGLARLANNQNAAVWGQPIVGKTIWVSTPMKRYKDDDFVGNYVNADISFTGHDGKPAKKLGVELPVSTRLGEKVILWINKDGDISTTAFIVPERNTTLLGAFLGVGTMLMLCIVLRPLPQPRPQQCKPISPRRLDEGGKSDFNSAKNQDLA